MPPLKLSDDELSAVMTACQPLAPDRRDAFMQAIADELQGCSVIGPGTVHRAIATAQRAHFNAPNLSRGRDYSRWR